MRKRRLAAALMAGLVASGSMAAAQSGRTSSMDGPQPRVAPGSRMGPEMFQGAYGPEAARQHLADMARHLSVMLEAYADLVARGQVPMGDREADAVKVLERMGAMINQLAWVVAEGRFPRRMATDMAQEREEMRTLMQRLPAMRALPSR